MRVLCLAVLLCLGAVTRAAVPGGGGSSVTLSPLFPTLIELTYDGSSTQRIPLNGSFDSYYPGETADPDFFTSPYYTPPIAQSFSSAQYVPGRGGPGTRSVSFYGGVIAIGEKEIIQALSGGSVMVWNYATVSVSYDVSQAPFSPNVDISLIYPHWGDDSNNTVTDVSFTFDKDVAMIGGFYEVQFDIGPMLRDNRLSIAQFRNGTQTIQVGQISVIIVYTSNVPVTVFVPIDGTNYEFFDATFSFITTYEILTQDPQITIIYDAGEQYIHENPGDPEALLSDFEPLGDLPFAEIDLWIPEEPNMIITRHYSLSQFNTLTQSTSLSLTWCPGDSLPDSVNATFGFSVPISYSTYIKVTGTTAVGDPDVTELIPYDRTVTVSTYGLIDDAHLFELQWTGSTQAMKNQTDMFFFYAERLVNAWTPSNGSFYAIFYDIETFVLATETVYFNITCVSLPTTPAPTTSAPTTSAPTTPTPTTNAPTPSAPTTPTPTTNAPTPSAPTTPTPTTNAPTPSAPTTAAPTTTLPDPTTALPTTSSDTSSNPGPTLSPGAIAGIVVANVVVVAGVVALATYFAMQPKAPISLLFRR